MAVDERKRLVAPRWRLDGSAEFIPTRILVEYEWEYDGRDAQNTFDCVQYAYLVAREELANIEGVSHLFVRSKWPHEDSPYRKSC
jgi:hypothetical protein